MQNQVMTQCVAYCGSFAPCVFARRYSGSVHKYGASFTLAPFLFYGGKYGFTQAYDSADVP